MVRFVWNAISHSNWRQDIEHKVWYIKEYLGWKQKMYTVRQYNKLNNKIPHNVCFSTTLLTVINSQNLNGLTLTNHAGKNICIQI
jgi:hypothetical protein